ncbi:MAG: ribonuclease D, partial [Planctomycetota bacterium]
ALIDPLEGVDLTGIWELIADPALRTIVHAGFQDLEPVVRHLDRPPANVVDTQIAAAFVGQPYPASLRKLVEGLLDVHLGKALTFTQWDHRPLSARHQHYAADDVRYLPALDAAIRRRLEELDHTAWCDDECAQLGDPAQYRFEPETQFWRVRGADRLDAKPLGILRALFMLRDEIAREHDVPPRTLLKDELLVTLSRTPPKELEQLRQIRGLPRPIAEGAGQRILDAIDAGRRSPPPSRPRGSRREDTATERARIDALFSIVGGYCRGRGIDPALVMTRTEIASLYREVARKRSLDDMRVMQGWRGELLRGIVLPFLSGELDITFRWEKDGLSCRTGPHESGD